MDQPLSPWTHQGSIDAHRLSCSSTDSFMSHLTTLGVWGFKCRFLTESGSISLRYVYLHLLVLLDHLARRFGSQTESTVGLRPQLSREA